MVDIAHDYTDDEIERLQKRFRRVYSDAAKEMREKLDDHMAVYDKENAEWKARVKSGEATQDEYTAWLNGMAQDREFVQGMADKLAQDAVDADKLAMAYINDSIPQVYAENANYAAYQIERAAGYDTHSFDLYDESTVRRLIADDDAPLLPKPSVDARKDKPWNQRKFSSAIAQSVLQGESIPNTAKRLQMVLNMDERAATRAARTAMTGAENAGRVDSYKRAERIGIQLEQEWMATFDERTRVSHRELHGQHVPVGQYFIASKTTGSRLLFPGDPSAPADEVYNCRCTLVAWLPDIEQEEKPLWTDWKDGTTYDEWKSGKKAEKERKEASGVVDGKDILGTWKRREGEFDFDIDDVINAQGFDGKPRVVPADEFDAAVRAANGGNGFIAQRIYNAPDQETLDSYREMLYRGHFYVDCSDGGAAYGRGMYTVSDYTGTISEDFRREIEVYRGFGGRPSYIETFTLDPSARLVEYNELQASKASLPQQIMDRHVLDYIESHADVLGEAGVEFAKRSEHVGGFEFDFARMSELDQQMTNEARDVARRARQEGTARAQEEINETYNLDLGAYAALMGYDGITVSGRGGSGSYTVILNRTKLIIREP